MKQENLMPRETEVHFWGNTPEDEYYKQQGIKASRSSYTSPRGLSLFTRSWLPISTDPPLGVMCMVHGYGNDISWTFQSTAIFLAQMGFACFALDIEGHGKSQGLKGYVPNVDLVVQDCLSFFDSIKNDTQFHGLPFFLYGESMGGAICLLIHLANPTGFDAVPPRFEHAGGLGAKHLLKVTVVASFGNPSDALYSLKYKIDFSLLEHRLGMLFRHSSSVNCSRIRRSFEEMMDFVISAPQGELCNENNCARVVKENRKENNPFYQLQVGKNEKRPSNIYRNLSSLAIRLM
ncbi:hypothetical protein D5086_022226 [Populus alba]|uniref:Uncharacterized protein n=1 Tax=Populus alba TaxID=43335 RepID=A0ACC4BEE1_POPAL